MEALVASLGELLEVGVDNRTIRLGLQMTHEGDLHGTNTPSRVVSPIPVNGNVVGVLFLGMGDLHVSVHAGGSRHPEQCIGMHAYIQVDVRSTTTTQMPLHGGDSS
jgi:hypothetical protein